VFILGQGLQAHFSTKGVALSGKFSQSQFIVAHGEHFEKRRTYPLQLPCFFKSKARIFPAPEQHVDAAQQYVTRGIVGMDFNARMTKPVRFVGPILSQQRFGNGHKIQTGRDLLLPRFRIFIG
jgi:hypothetical protein